ncbi:MAG TPA: hypothetical protein VKE94_14525, partial [Gemmataceae bacterium]|nr:hypothetical protein [Gemmataceae bacterium]
MGWAVADTCAYFDQLDYYPRKRADLKKHDTVTYRLMELQKVPGGPLWLYRLPCRGCPCSSCLLRRGPDGQVHLVAWASLLRD